VEKAVKITVRLFGIVIGIALVLITNSLLIGIVATVLWIALIGGLIDVFRNEPKEE
jgi:hypothetical protein